MDGVVAGGVGELAVRMAAWKKVANVGARMAAGKAAWRVAAWSAAWTNSSKDDCLQGRMPIRNGQS